MVLLDIGTFEKFEPPRTDAGAKTRMAAGAVPMVSEVFSKLCDLLLDAEATGSDLGLDDLRLASAHGLEEAEMLVLVVGEVDSVIDVSGLNFHASDSVGRLW